MGSGDGDRNGCDPLRRPTEDPLFGKTLLQAQSPPARGGGLQTTVYSKVVGCRRHGSNAGVESYDGPDGVFDRVVVDRVAAIVGDAGQRMPALQGSVHRLVQAGARSAGRVRLCAGCGGTAPWFRDGSRSAPACAAVAAGVRTSRGRITGRGGSCCKARYPRACAP